jgi:lipoate---protein ligase
LIFMYCFSLNSYDPSFNLAIEEVLLKNSTKEYLILAINSPSVIIGKNQSAHKETNTGFITENNIPVIRRISGGGTVFHDFGNLNFTFIRECEEGKQIDYRKHTKPVIDFLLSCGIDARFEGKNDIRIEGLKISGNAEHIHRNRVLHHGTILFSTSLEILRNSIRKDKSCYSSRAVNSNPSSVMNLQEKLKKFSDIYELRTTMMDYFLKNLAGAERYSLSPQETAEAESLATSKYRTWEWNYAFGPEYSFTNSFQINGEPYSCGFFVKNGIIMNFTVEGSRILKEASKNLAGCRHMVNDIQKIFRKENILITKEEAYNFF